MTKRMFFVILWLMLSFSVLAQGPERAKPASETKTQPCWEQEVKSMAEGAYCFGVFIEELTKQKNNSTVLEELGLAGVRFLKANGYSDEAAARMVANQIKKLSTATETSVPTKPETTEVVKPTPAVSEVTPRQAALVDRVEASARDKRLRDERQEGWKAGLPRPEEKSGYCWEGTRQNDLLECITQLKQYIKQVKADKSLPSERRQLAVTNLRDDLEKLEKLQKSAEKGVKTQRTWATSRSKSFLTGCNGTWVSEDNAGPGSQWNPSVTLTVVNNTGMDIKTISLSDRGPIVENLCAGGSVVIHRGWNGSMNGQNFSFMAIAEVVEGGTPRKYLWKLTSSIYPNGSPQSTDWILTGETRQSMGYY